MQPELREALSDNSVGIEDGHIYFLYRPIRTEAHGLRDVNFLSIVMHPLTEKKYRLISLDASRLPAEGDTFNFVTGVVEKVDSKPRVIQHRLGPLFREAQGEPVVGQAAARACAEGTYSLIHFEDGIHLVYIVEIPSVEFSVQKELEIHERGNFLLGIFNPYYGSPTEEEEAQPDFPRYPDDLRLRLGEDRIVFHDTPGYLDVEYTRISLYRSDSESAVKISSELHPLADTYQTADIFRDLGLRQKTFPVDPLFHGTWV